MDVVKETLKRWFYVRDEECVNMLILMAFPVLITTVTLYSALFSVVYLILLLSFNICASVLFEKFKLEANVSAILVLLDGAITIMVATVAQNIVADSFWLFFAAMIYSLGFYMQYEKNREDKLSLRIKCTLKYLLIAVCAIVILSFARELLSSGCIFSVFTQNGIRIFNHKFGGYINTASGLFLVLAAVAYAISLLRLKNPINIKFEKGIVKLVIVSFIITLPVTFITFGLSYLFKLISVPFVTLIIPFVLSAGIMHLLVRWYDGDTSKIISVFSLVFSVFVCFSATSLLDLIFGYALLFVMITIASLWSVIISSDFAKNKVLPAILLMISLISLVYEKII